MNPYTGKEMENITEGVNIETTKTMGKCSCTWGLEFEPLLCIQLLPCGVCEIKNEDNQFLLKGQCEVNLIERQDYDQNYYIHGLVNGKLHFKGYYLAIEVKNINDFLHFYRAYKQSHFL